MRYRTGRKNGHTVYLQTGDEPSDHDPFVGSCVTPGHARNLADHATAGLAAKQRLDALEEIRQRVADGWTADRSARRWVEYLRNDSFEEPMSEQVASLLWPEDTSA